MRDNRLQECLNGQTDNYLLPFLWYAGEDAKTVCKALDHIKSLNIHQVTLENRGGNWFCKENWFEVMDEVLEYAEKINMGIWLLDDSHVATGSANDSLRKEENKKFRPQNLRIQPIDLVGPLEGGAVKIPKLTEQEEVLSVSAYRRDEGSGHSYGDPVDLRDCLRDGLCLIDLPAGVWRVYFVIKADPQVQRGFAYYITMLSKESCRHLIDEVHEKIYARLGKHFGKSIVGFFSDEPSFGNCNGEYHPGFTDYRMGQMERFHCWWDDMAASLSKRTGHPEGEVWLRLPAMWDEVDGLSPLYRLAYMDEITERWRVNYSCQLGDWCREHGVSYIGHNLEDAGAHKHLGFGCGHLYRSMDGQDMAGVDIVLNQMVPGINTIDHTANIIERQHSYKFYHHTLAKMTASLAHINPRMKGRLLCEIMGGYGWPAGVSVQFALYNFFLANGTTHFIPHEFSMVMPKQFAEETGETTGLLRDFPENYRRWYMPPAFTAGGYNPQTPAYQKLFNYVQRVCHLMGGQPTHRPDLAIYYNAESDWMGGQYQELDDVATCLAHGGFDYDILPLDTLLRDASVENGRLLVARESYGALVLPYGERIPKALLDRLAQFSRDGLEVIFVDCEPMETEFGKSNALKLLPDVRTPSMEWLVSCLDRILTRRVRFATKSKGLRFYDCVRDDGTELCMFLNEGRESVDTVVHGDWSGSCVLYDPWRNAVYRPQVSGDGFRLKLAPQQLLVAIFGETDDVPKYPYDCGPLKPLELVYDIYARSATSKEFKLIKAQTAPFNLNLLEGMTRFCGEFKYETAFEWTNDALPTKLVIPGQGDCAELILNGTHCGLSLGPDRSFDIAGVIRQGKNTMTIVTADNLSYMDRESELFGHRMALMPHGFTNHVMVNYEW